MNKYQKLEDESIIETFNTILKSKYFPIDVNFQFTSITKGKKLIELKKIPDSLSPVIDKDIQVIINEEIYDRMDDKSIEIIFEQEIERISFNMKTGKISLSNASLKVFPGIVEKWGIEDIARAYEIEEASTKEEK